MDLRRYKSIVLNIDMERHAVDAEINKYEAL